MNRKHRSSSRLFSVLILLALVLGAFTAGNVTGFMARSVAASQEPAEFAVFWEAWDLVVAHFVDRDRIDFRSMTYGAIQGMLSSLGDEGHTAFLSPEELAQHESSLEGSYQGIGAYVAMEDGQVVIVAPIAGSPAEEAGIVAGDVILAVDGEPITEQTLSQVISRIRGPAGSPVILTVLHPDAEETVEIQVVRGEIQLKSVDWALIPGQELVYVQVSQFAAETSQELKAALREIQELRRQGTPIQGMVLDLRNNPGGYVREATAVTSQFLSPGKVIFLEQDAEGNIQKYKSRGWGLARDIPLVVLINQGTASAGEITAGALQENGRAQLVGETTFGTGTVLNQFNLSDGSAILLGVTNWLTPNGRLIKGQGIDPDIPVEQPATVTLLDARQLREITATELLETEDAQFRKALELLTSPTPDGQQAGANHPRLPTLELQPGFPESNRLQVH